MPYDLPSLSDQHLKQIYLVINDLVHKSELLGSHGPIVLGNSPKGVNRDEQLAILGNLDNEKLVSFSIGGKHIYINEGLYIGKSFNRFWEDVHKEYHKRFNATAKVNNQLPHYDEVNGIIYIKQFQIQIRRQSKDTYENQILKHIFADKDNLKQEFDYNNFPFDLAEQIEQKEKIWSRCRTACLAINKKIAETSNNKITDFLQFNSRKHGWLNINPIYLRG